MSLDVHVHMGGLPPAKKPIVVSSVFDASVNRMVVTAVFPMRDGKVYVNDERESVQRIVTKAIRSEYHNGNSGEVERMKAEIARLQEIIMKQGLQAESDTKAVAELTAKVNEQAEFILKQRSRINGLKTQAFAYTYGMSNNVNPLSNEGFVELFFQQPGVITAQHHDEIQVIATEEFWAKLHTMWKDLPSRRNCEIVELEDPIPMMSLNIFELAALQMYCQDYGSNVLLQRRDGKLIISSPTCRNPVEVEVHHG